MPNPVAVLANDGCPEELPNGTEGSILTIENDCPTWVNPTDGGAILHPAATVNGACNPALDIDVGTQVLCLDLTTNGSFDSSSSPVGFPGNVQTAIQVLSNFAVNPRVPTPVTDPLYFFDTTTWTLDVPLPIMSRSTVDNGIALQAIPAQVITPIANWNAGPIYDTAGLVTAPGQITIPRTGAWEIFGQVGVVDATPGTSISVMLNVNGIQNQAAQFTMMPPIPFSGQSSFYVKYRLPAAAILTLDVFSETAGFVDSGSFAALFVGDA